MKGGPLAAKALVRAVILLALITAAGFVAVKLRPQPPQSGRATLFFPNTTVEVTTAPDASHVVVDFRFENRSEETITIAEVEKNCTCVEMGITDGKLTYAPGERGAIRARFELETLSGTVEKPFKLWLKGDPADQPSFTLTPRIKIPVLVEVSAKTLKWEVGGAAMPQMAEITIRHDRPIRVVDVSSSLDSFGVALKTIEEGRRYQLRVTPTEPLTPRLAIIRVATDSPSSRWKVVNFFAMVEAKPEPPPAP